MSTQGCLSNIHDIIPASARRHGFRTSMNFDADVETTRFCFEGKTFWLVMPYKHGPGGLLGSVFGTDAVRFKTPYGVAMLNGQATQYGGLSWRDIIISSYYAWTNNSHINPAPKPSAEFMASAGSAAWAQSVQYPGFFNYAVCNGLAGVVAAAQSFSDGVYSNPC